MSRKLDVMLVVAGDLGSIYQGFNAEHHDEPSAAGRLIAAYLMRRGCGVDLIDGTIRRLSEREAALGLTIPRVVAADAVSATPYLVVILVFGNEPSSSTMTMPAGRAFAQAIRELNPSLPIMMCGPHPAALPERTLREEPVDCVCDGEGPITTYELLQAMKAGGDLKKVRSLCYMWDGVFVRNASAPLLDLDEEPATLGWSLRDMHPGLFHCDAWHNFWQGTRDERANYANPFAGFGCVYHCEFCMTNAIFRSGESADSKWGIASKPGEIPVIGQQKYKNSQRHLSPRLFVNEVEYLVHTFGVRNFKIPDEMFWLNAKHVEEISLLLKQRFGDALNFWAYARIDTTLAHPRLLDLARQGGIKHLAMGIEAGNREVRKGQDKGFGTPDVYRVQQLLRSADINMPSNYIFGLPGETPESMRETYALACELNTPFANFYCTKSLPGSELHRQAVVAGYPLPEREGGPGWSGYSQYGRDAEVFYQGEFLTSHVITNYRDLAHVDYYSRSEYQEMLRRDPQYGETAIATVDRWLKGVRHLDRKPASAHPETRISLEL